jgi:hypothetical protein
MTASTAHSSILLLAEDNAAISAALLEPVLSRVSVETR